MLWGDDLIPGKQNRVFPLNKKTACKFPLNDRLLLDYVFIIDDTAHLYSWQRESQFFVITICGKFTIWSCDGYRTFFQGNDVPSRSDCSGIEQRYSLCARVVADLAISILLTGLFQDLKNLMDGPFTSSVTFLALRTFSIVLNTKV